MSNKEVRLVVGSTGGSGIGYLLRMFYHLARIPGETHWIASDNFFKVYETEYGKDTQALEKGKIAEVVSENYGLKDNEIVHRFQVHEYRDISAAPSSGSVYYDAMIVIPCSMKTLGAIAGGISSNLIERAADVSLKERRKLILVPRETPYSLIHIENMRTVTLAGGIVMPASPGFYNRPQTMDDLFDFMVDRVFMHAGIGKRIIKPWAE